jgi:hypothetical protein
MPSAKKSPLNHRLVQEARILTLIDPDQKTKIEGVTQILAQDCLRIAPSAIAAYMLYCVSELTQTETSLDNSDRASGRVHLDMGILTHTFSKRTAQIFQGLWTTEDQMFGETYKSPDARVKDIYIAEAIYTLESVMVKYQGTSLDTDVPVATLTDVPETRMVGEILADTLTFLIDDLAPAAETTTSTRLRDRFQRAIAAVEARLEGNSPAEAPLPPPSNKMGMN